MTRQYLACSFRPGGRHYTYHHDGAPVSVGAEVKIPARDGDGWQRVKVEAILPVPPAFETKPILGVIDRG